MGWYYDILEEHRGVSKLEYKMNIKFMKIPSDDRKVAWPNPIRFKRFVIHHGDKRHWSLNMNIY